MGVSNLYLLFQDLHGKEVKKVDWWRKRRVSCKLKLSKLIFVVCDREPDIFVQALDFMGNMQVFANSILQHLAPRTWSPTTLPPWFSLQALSTTPPYNACWMNDYHRNYWGHCGQSAGWPMYDLLMMQELLWLANQRPTNEVAGHLFESWFLMNSVTTSSTL